MNQGLTLHSTLFTPPRLMWRGAADSEQSPGAEIAVDHSCARAVRGSTSFMKQGNSASA